MESSHSQYLKKHPFDFTTATGNTWPSLFDNSSGITNHFRSNKFIKTVYTNNEKYNLPATNDKIMIPNLAVTATTVPLIKC